MDASPLVVYGGATAIYRTSASRPLRFWREHGLLVGDVLDFGAGHEQHEFPKYDAFWHPDPAPLRRSWDVVMCNYVLNVQPVEHLIVQTCALLARLIRPAGVVLVATRKDIAHSYQTARGFQIAKTEEQWAALLRAVFANVRPAPAANTLHGFICTV